MIPKIIIILINIITIIFNRSKRTKFNNTMNNQNKPRMRFERRSKKDNQRGVRALRRRLANDEAQAQTAADTTEAKAVAVRRGIKTPGRQVDRPSNQILRKEKSIRYEQHRLKALAKAKAKAKAKR